MANVVNQKQTRLVPSYTDSIQQDMDVLALVKACAADPLFEPLLQGQPVTIKDLNNKSVTPDSLTDLILHCCDGQIHSQEEDIVKDILSQTLIAYDKHATLTVDDMFVTQSGTAAKLDEPSSNVIYTPAADVIPSAKSFLLGRSTNGASEYDVFFASLAYYARPRTVGFYFINELAFNDFKAWFAAQAGMMSGVLSTDVNKLVADFNNITLTGLTESLILRQDDSDALEPLSFPRLLISLLMQYAQTTSPSVFGCMPFSFSEFICPRTVVFINVEKHSRATARQIADEWNMINSALQNKTIHMVSKKTLSKLTAAQRAARKIAAAASSAAMTGGMLGTGKAGNIKFSKTRPKTVDIAKSFKKILDKMSFVNKSMNVYKRVKPSFAKPNRRDPDDYNKPGKVVSTQYKPDIHVYIDTSGSITETDYEGAMRAIIAMAKKLDINVYFNSFSHNMSQTTRLKLQGKSVAEAYNEFSKIQKVTGGTDYEQIWHFINASKKRTRELSLIITDFEWTASSGYFKHPKNLYYAPCATTDWDWLKREAESFVKSMLHIEPNIRSRLLF